MKITSQKLTAALMAMLLCATLQAATPEEIVDAEFSHEIGQAIRTPHPDDDIALARKMLQRAREPETTEEICATLCSEAWKLTAKAPGGARTAIAAMDLLAHCRPLRQREALERILALQQARRDAATDPHLRRAHELTLYQLHLELAGLLARDGEDEETRKHLATAEELADSLELTRTAALRRARQRVRARLAAADTAAELREQLAATPDASDLRRKLVTLYLVELDSPALAMAALRSDLDVTLRSYVPLLVRPAETAPPEICRETAAWLAQLAGSADAIHRPHLLLRARRFLHAALLQLPGDAPALPVVRKQLLAIDESLQAFRAAGPTGPWSLDVWDLEILGDDAIHQAVSLAKNALLAKQNPDGSWPGETLRPGQEPRPDWPTALAALALMEAGMDPHEAPLAKALDYLADNPTDVTAALAVRCRLWQQLQEPLHGLYNPELLSETRLLLRGTADGSYADRLDPVNPTENGDVLNTHWALRGVAWGQYGGVKVEDAYWRQGLAWLLRSQNRNGGWGLGPEKPSAPLPSVAGAATLLLCLDHVGRSREEALRHGALQLAMTWVQEHIAEDPSDHPLQYLFAASHLGTALGEQDITATPWYLQTRRVLLKHQTPRGQWATSPGPSAATTALGVLTLTGPQRRLRASQNGFLQAGP